MTKIKCLMKESKGNLDFILWGFPRLSRAIMGVLLWCLPAFVMLVVYHLTTPSTEYLPPAVLLGILAGTFVWVVCVAIPIDARYISKVDITKPWYMHTKENLKFIFNVCKDIPKTLVVICIAFLPAIPGLYLVVQYVPDESGLVRLLSVIGLFLVTGVWAVIIGLPVVTCYFYHPENTG
jgi:hypothetical protein